MVAGKKEKREREGEGEWRIVGRADINLDSDRFSIGKFRLADLNELEEAETDLRG